MPRNWSFGIVLLVQFGVLVYLPAGQIAARASGTAVTLRTGPVDPYDVLSGYYVTLRYGVEADARTRLPAGLEKGDLVWLVLEPGEPAWTLAGVERERPNPQQGRVAVPAEWRGSDVRIVGASRLYVSESRRERARELLREAGGGGLVEMKVADDGTAALIALVVGGERFGEN